LLVDGSQQPPCVLLAHRPHSRWWLCAVPVANPSFNTMSSHIYISRHVWRLAVPRRRVQCACSPDFGQRPLLESKVLDVTEVPYGVSPTLIESSPLLPSETKHADEWIGSSSIVSVSSTGGTTFAELESCPPLVPKTEEETDSKGLGAFLMQTPPVRCALCVAHSVSHHQVTMSVQPLPCLAGRTCIS
jgi:hypothetical protein